MTWKIDVGMYCILTDDDMEEKLSNDKLGFIAVNEKGTGKICLIVTSSIICIREIDTDEVINLDAASNIVDNVFGAIFGPRKTETVTIEEDEDNE